jgi:hypothetical protein
MMITWIPSYLDELEKLARLTKNEERRQALQFAGLGAAAVPVSSGIANLIEHGKLTGLAKSPGRWLGARLAGGALAFGALPAIRNVVARSNVRKANLRRKLEADLRAMNIARPIKTAAEVKSKYKLRSKTRPYRAETLIKKLSSPAGADLRIPLMGGTKFPTSDSLAPIKQKLQKSQKIGVPQDPKGVKLDDVIPKFGSSGDVMDFSADPLVQYLRKQAAATPPPPMKVSGGALEDNKEELEKGEETKELVSENPNPEPPSSVSEWYRQYLSKQVKNVKGIDHKYLEKDHKAAPGALDKALKRHGVKHL